MTRILAVIASVSITIIAAALDLSFSTALTLSVCQSLFEKEKELLTYCNWYSFSRCRWFPLRLWSRSVSVRRIDWASIAVSKCVIAKYIIHCLILPAIEVDIA